jgi:hypothetical protein
MAKKKEVYKNLKWIILTYEFKHKRRKYRVIQDQLKGFKFARFGYWSKKDGGVWIDVKDDCEIRSILERRGLDLSPIDMNVVGFDRNGDFKIFR